ncbi:hypothetical protein WJX72_002920 [[Myrmecia] bisecta]|uniref:Uncharacterized protein n=1 Tax=[Myrmecia] bisecta TaxID=41462 RepID=A0AAW1PVV5_9CHLO
MLKHWRGHRIAKVTQLSSQCAARFGRGGFPVAFAKDLTSALGGSQPAATPPGQVGSFWGAARHEALLRMLLGST